MLWIDKSFSNARLCIKSIAHHGTASHPPTIKEPPATRRVWCRGPRRRRRRAAMPAAATKAVTVAATAAAATPMHRHSRCGGGRGGLRGGGVGGADNTAATDGDTVPEGKRPPRAAPADAPPPWADALLPPRIRACGCPPLPPRPLPPVTAGRGGARRPVIGAAAAGERGPRVRRHRQPRRRVWQTVAASPPPAPTGSGRNGGHNWRWCARTCRVRSRRQWSRPRAARRHGQGATTRWGPPAQLPSLLRGGASPCTAAAERTRRATPTAEWSRADCSRRKIRPSRRLEANEQVCPLAVSAVQL